MTEFCFTSFRFWQKFEKTISEKEFFNEIWLILGGYEYINIAGKKIEIFIPWDFKGKTFFQHPQNANLW